MLKERIVSAGGYPCLYAPRHPKAGILGYVPEHVLVAEKALGKYLPKGCEVHHIDENKLNVSSNNLVICQDNAYHKLLHQRQRAFNACGNANFRKCFHCELYSDPKTMKAGNTKGFTHWDCYRQYMREYYNNNKEKWGVKVNGAC